MKKSVLLFSLLSITTLVSCGKTPVSSSANVMSSSEKTSVSTSSKPSDSSVGKTSTSSQNQTQGIKKVSVLTVPKKTNYFLDNENDRVIDLTGGVVEVTFSDGSTKDIPITDESVTVVAPDLTIAGEKNVVVRYGGKKRVNQASFTIGVLEKGAKVNFDINYDGGVDFVKEFVIGTAAVKPSDPTREGFAFDSWYSDEKATLIYDFSTLLDKDITLYGNWLENGVTYQNVIFDLNYYGVAPQSFPQKVKKGNKAVLPSIKTERKGFSFGGWFTDEGLTSAFSIDQTIESDTHVYAKWNKNKTASSQYVFEAEETDLSGKNGPGFSGSASGQNMIVKSTDASVSNGKYVSYLFKKGASLEFYLGSSEAVSDATLTLRVSLETQLGIDKITFSQGNFGIIVNGTSQNYSVELSASSTYSDAIVIDNVSLKEGANLIKLETLNDGSEYSLAGTYAAVAPNIDCLKIDTTSVLIWDQNHSLPMEY